MKQIRVFFTTSTQGVKLIKNEFRFLLKILQKNNCINLNDFIENVIFSNIDYQQTTKQKNDLYIKSLKLINKANFLIADITYASITVGRQIEYALQKDIPVLCLLNKKNATYISPSMFDTEIKLQTFRSYDNKSLATVLNEYVKSYKNKKIRFNLFISKENENFLNWFSKKKQISKSGVVRELIEDKINDNKEYSEYIN